MKRGLVFEELTNYQEQKVFKLLDFADRVIDVQLIPEKKMGIYVPRKITGPFIKVTYSLNGRVYTTKING